jgi:hypothetical protein
VKINFNARYYDPITGRFLTEDPSRKGVNWYAYCENDPVNMTDPTGRLPVDDVANTARGLQLIRADRPMDDLTYAYAKGLSAGICAIPIAGSLYDFAQAAAGKEFFTGETLSPAGRIITAASGVIGLIPFAGKLAEGALAPEAKYLTRAIESAISKDIALKPSLTNPGLSVVDERLATVMSAQKTLGVVGRTMEAVEPLKAAGVGLLPTAAAENKSK